MHTTQNCQYRVNSGMEIIVCPCIITKSGEQRARRGHTLSHERCASFSHALASSSWRYSSIA